MDAESLLKSVARNLYLTKLETVMIGNGAAAIHGAPITTLDIDFMFRSTPVNLKKLRSFADNMGATVFRPYYPTSKLYRVCGDSGFQIDFMSQVHGIRSFASLRSRAVTVNFGQYSLLVADLSDIIKSKRAAGRPQDRAALPILEKTLNEKKVVKNKGTRRAKKRKRSRRDQADS